jgi:hypothetical protein
MRSVGVLVASVALAASPALLDAQRRTPARKPPPPAKKTEAARVTCPEVLGTGVRTKAQYCFVLAGRDPAGGIRIAIPPHAGNATLTFDLHNRHTYSEEEVKAGRGFAKYSAVIGILTMDGQLLGRGAVQSEFRKAPDLFERISGGAGPGGVKAVAPIGRESVAVTIPAKVNEVSLLGELLEATTSAGRESAAFGHPVAIVSNVTVEYQPVPGKR